MTMGTLMQVLGLGGRAPAADPGLQNAAMCRRGLGWKAERCLEVASCELHLCTPDANGRHWHPDDPLAFAKWRVRADLDSLPPHVLVRIAVQSGIPSAIKRGVVIGVLGLSGTAALAVWFTRHGRKQRACPV